MYSAKRKCGECGQDIVVGQACLAAIGKTFHQTCFSCVKCGTQLDSKFFRLELQGGTKTKVACDRCYEFLSTQGNRCATCNEFLIDCDFVAALGKNYHTEHFTCASCNKLVKDGYYAVNDKAYCREVPLHLLPSLLCYKLI